MTVDHVVVVPGRLCPMCGRQNIFTDFQSIWCGGGNLGGAEEKPCPWEEQVDPRTADKLEEERKRLDRVVRSLQSEADYKNARRVAKHQMRPINFFLVHALRRERQAAGIPEPEPVVVRVGSARMVGRAKSLKVICWFPKQLRRVWNLIHEGLRRELESHARGGVFRMRISPPKRDPTHRLRAKSRLDELLRSGLGPTEAIRQVSDEEGFSRRHLWRVLAERRTTDKP